NSPKQPVVKVSSEVSHSAEPTRQILPAGNANTSEPTSEAVKVAVEKLNTQIQSLQRDLSFSIDEDSGRTVVRVIDSETKEVVRQIPSEEVLKLAQQLEVILSEVGEQLSGVLLEEQA
ncbi:MAG: flagellar protein FlaG, partial [Gammaproteobacteria bacterium]|nr:flagellar protein FlaG [Gammaproteobacteria bacterium]